MYEIEKVFVFTTNTLFGVISAGCTEQGVVVISIGKSDSNLVLKQASFSGYEVVKEKNVLGAQLEQELNEYFSGVRKKFMVKGEIKGTPFQEKVWQTLSRVPYGSVVSYSELAFQAGYPKAARAVGTAMASNRLPILVPCHRVVSANGQLGGYGGGVDLKKKLLELEKNGIFK